MFTLRFRQNVVLLMLFDAFSRFRARFRGGGNIECMIFVRVFKVFRLRPILCSLCVFAKTWFYQCFLMPFHVSAPDFRGGENIECMIFVRVFEVFWHYFLYFHPPKLVVLPPGAPPPRGTYPPPATGSGGGLYIYEIRTFV